MNRLKLELDGRDANVLLQALRSYRGPWDGEVPDNPEDKKYHGKCMYVANAYKGILEDFLYKEYEKWLKSKITEDEEYLRPVR